MTEQLSIFKKKLERAIKKGWRYMFLVKGCKFLMGSSHLTTKDAGYTISYHELFSKDSGLMEAVEWKETYEDLRLNAYVSDGDLEYDDSYYDIDFHYMMMGKLSSDQKVLYFNNNTTDDA